ncbi:trimethylguanosine synthase-like [Daktulosphaira vitifoliae]|uniref:trimethylguanosine synthase-like n=1 Tax=Daktulosphaira vitifoliae TaxID=58002 RepID=UPI0021AAE4C5|nr:trimethylguanosine synthase-like [Daktulosphaira vitifoliae]
MNTRTNLTTHPINLEIPFLTNNSIVEESLGEDKFAPTTIIETEKELSKTSIEKSFYSVCPEILSTHIALRCPGLDVAMDPFCGAGGNVIQLAKRYTRVIAVDIDAKKLEFAERNAEIYGVRDKVTFIQGDFFGIAETLKKYKPRVILTSPPWGGPSYKKHEVYSLEKNMCNEYKGGGKKLFDLLRSIVPNVAHT